MNVIVCVDDNKGMLFNKRRQSRDKAVIDKIINITKNNVLLITDFSQNLFGNTAAKVKIYDNPLVEAETDDYCFIENLAIKDYANKINKLYVFKWNRKYPHDSLLDIDLSKYRLLSSEDFTGNSHDNITLEVYIR